MEKEQMQFILIVGISFIVIIIVLFLLLRELVLWYWKQNEIISLLKEQNNLLRKIAGEKQLEEEKPLPKVGLF